MKMRKRMRRKKIMKMRKEEVRKLKKVVKNISNFVKRIIFVSVGNALPCPMPYPVINTILSYLLPVRGAANIGPVTTDDSKDDEKNDMIELYLTMAHAFGDVQAIMLDCEPSAMYPQYIKYISEQIVLLVKMFEDLVEKVKSTGLQISSEGLDIEHTGGEEEKVMK